MKHELSVQQVNGGAEKRRKQKQVIRAKDLSTRERVNFVISTEIMSELRDKSTEDDIPMSRIVDAALIQYFNAERLTLQVNSLESGINLYHHLEFLLYQSLASDFTQKFINLVHTYLNYFTYSSCLLKKYEDESIVGAKIFSFVADTQQEALSQLLNEEFLLDNKQYIKIMLDSRPIQV